jgi:MFS transporter, DHA1 family, multidrug resistance protein
MFLSPLQELPILGRNPVYIGTLFIFVLFQLPIAIAKNFSTVLAFRFLTGFFGSPALATGVSSTFRGNWPNLTTANIGCFFG